MVKNIERSVQFIDTHTYVYIYMYMYIYIYCIYIYIMHILVFTLYWSTQVTMRSLEHRNVYNIANSTGFFKVSQIDLIGPWPQLPHLQITGVGPTSMMNDVSQRYIQFHANTLPLRCFDKWIMQSTNFRVVTGKQKSKYSPVKPWCTTTSRARSTHAFQIGVQLFCLPERMQQHKAQKLWDTKESQCPIWGTVQEPVSIMILFLNYSFNSQILTEIFGTSIHVLRNLFSGWWF